MKPVPIIQQFFQVKINSFLPFFIKPYSNLGNKASLSLWSLIIILSLCYPFKYRVLMSLTLYHRPIKLHRCTVHIYRLINRYKKYLILVAYQVQQSTWSQIQRLVSSLKQKKHCDRPNDKNQIKRARLEEHSVKGWQLFYELGLYHCQSDLIWVNQIARVQILSKSFFVFTFPLSCILLGNLCFLLSTSEL